MQNDKECELTILMPCLNEAETLEICINKARKFLDDNQIDGEILIADNGSTDGSQKIALRNGARLICVEKKGYGSALRGGNEQAKGKYIIMGDADDSYDFEHLMPFLEKLREGNDLVMGNRFAGGIEKGAMPFSHRWIGNPVLSFLGRLFYGSKIRDFHCGLRGYNRERIKKLFLITTGMEYASEMIVKATLNAYKVVEVPTTLKKDGRSRPPHLRSFRDGWRHLKFLLMHSPNWLFLYPGIVISMLGFLCSILLIVGNVTLPHVSFGIHSLLYACTAMVIGINIIFFSVYTKVYAHSTGFIPKNKSIEKIAQFSVDKGALYGIILILLGGVATTIAFAQWKETNFVFLRPENTMRIVIPALAMIQIGVLLLFSSLFIGVLKIAKQD